MVSWCPLKILFPLCRMMLIFCIAGLLFCVPQARRTIGSVTHPAETGLLIPSEKFECIGRRRSAWCTKAELSDPADSETLRRLLMESMYYIGLDVHKKMISYCVKDRSGQVHSEGRI